MDLEVEACDVRDGEKIDTGSIGSLVRKDGRDGVINDFGSGKKFLHKLHDQDKYSINYYAHRNRHNVALDANLDLPRTSIERDLNTTRI